jgi:hypothetical protein
VAKKGSPPKTSGEHEEWGVPTDAAAERLGSETDALRVAVLGWQYLDSILWLGLSDCLPGADVKELKGLKMSVKVDVATGLGLVNPAERPTLRKLNAIRNKFVHEQKSGWTRTDSRELTATWSPIMRKIARENGVSARGGDVLDTLRLSMMVMAVALKEGVTRRRDEQTGKDKFFEALQIAAYTPSSEWPWAEAKASEWIEEETAKQSQERRGKGML